MNKIFLKTVAIIALLAPVSIGAMRKRVDSPGVAQHRLELAIKGARSMTEKEREQALADLSPALKEDYKEMLANIPVKSKENFKNAFNATKTVVMGGDLDQEDLNQALETISQENNLKYEEKKDLKNIAQELNKEKKDKEENLPPLEEEYGSLKKVELEDQQNGTTEVKDKEDQAQQLSKFLSDLLSYFNIQLSDSKDSWRVKGLVSDTANRFTTDSTGYEELIVRVNNFFIELQKFQSQIFNSITCIQKAFLENFFPLIYSLWGKVKDSQIPEDSINLFGIIEKGNKILKTQVKGETIVEKKEENNKDKNNEPIIIQNRTAYNVFAMQSKKLSEKINSQKK